MTVSTSEDRPMLKGQKIRVKKMSMLAKTPPIEACNYQHTGNPIPCKGIHQRSEETRRLAAGSIRAADFLGIFRNI